MDQLVVKGNLEWNLGKVYSGNIVVEGSFISQENLTICNSSSSNCSVFNQTLPFLASGLFEKF